VSPRLSDLLLSSQSDERLVSLARAGHERAFAAIVERYAPELQAMARRLCSDGRSEDVVQQAFLSAFTALRAGCEVRHLRGWLYRIVRNTAGRSESPTLLPLDRTTASANVLEEVVQQRALAIGALSEIGRLPARQRQAMIGTALDGRPRAEIATSMGLSEGAVRQLVHRARTALRSAVTALTPWPLARWIATAGPDAPGPAELAAGAGAASSGGLALKLGALLASGTFLTGAAVHLQARPPDRGSERAVTSVHGRREVARAQPVAVASVAPALLAGAGSAGAGTTGTRTGVALRVAHPRAPHTIVHHRRHAGTSTRSGERSDQPPVEIRDGGHGDRTEHGDSGGGTGRDGTAALTPPKSGSGSGGQGDGRTPGRDGGTGSDGKDGGTGGGSDDGGQAQIAADSQPIEATVEGSGSRGGSDSGETSGGGTASSSGSGSGGGSGSSDGGSGSSDGGSGSSDGGSGSSPGGGTSGG
jgi:RNA polymerase sigma factor (sigma-70 family)